MSKYVKFHANTYKRSSKENYNSSLPGEAEILKLNPQREQLITKTMGWKRLEPGTLNIKLDDSLYDKINQITPKINEPPVKYPEKHQSIPKKRGGYLYWKCKLYYNGKKTKGLFRAAKNRIEGVGEIVGNVNFRKEMGIQDEAEIKVKVYGNAKEEPNINEAVGNNYFYKTNKEIVELENIYNGAHVFLCLSGPSFNSINKEPLKFVYTMCVNNGVKALMPHCRPDLWTCVDGADKFLYTTWQDPKILKIVPETHKKKWLWNSDKNMPVGKRVCDCPNVIYMQLNNQFNADTFLDEPTFNWGNNSEYEDPNGVKGKRSVFHSALKMLYVLGFRHVYLLGADFKMGVGADNYSFNQDRKESSVKQNNSSYKQINYRMELLKPNFEKAGFNVYNCTKDSGLKAFPFMDYNEALNHALGFVHKRGLYTRGKLENTKGLYETKWYICPQCKHSQRISKEQVKNGISCACGRTITEKDRSKYVQDKDQMFINS